MKNKFLLFIISIFCLPAFLSATHIVGGSLTYEQLGGSTYRVTLKVYRDCAAGNAAFDNNIIIEVLQANGNAFVPSKNISIPLGTITKLNPYVDTCVVKPNICVEEAIYTKVVNNLPPFAGGYHLFWQRCCRNASVANITTPLTSGESFYTFIPDNNLLLNNSSPTWVNSPPTFVCQGQPISFNHAATDADGDSLVYKLYDPYVGCDGTTVQSPNCATAYPTFPGNVATFSKVVWNGGYSTNNPMGGGGLTMSSTGLLNGIPPTIGQFVVGVKCEEWRNGVKIGEILRDFQFNVVSCPPLSVPNFTSTGGCSGTAVTFTNTTTPTSTKYFWDFGNTAVLTDTSIATNPSYTYPTLGTYTVTLISNKGTACADTAIKIVNVSSVSPNFTSNAPGCVGMAVNFTDASTAPAPSTINNWLWKFGDGTSSPLQNPSHTYSTSGTFTVTLIATSSAGCKDSIKKTVLIQNLPVPNFTPNGLCSGTNISFTNTTTPAATTYLWNFGNTATLADTSHLVSPTYNYPSIGTYTVTLIVNKGTACAITFTKKITVSSVIAGFIDNGPGCVGMAVNFTDTSKNSSNTTIAGWSWNFGDGGTSPSQSPTHTYIASGTYTVTLTVTTASGCNGTATHVVNIQNTPIPNFNYTGVCNGKTIKFTNATVPPGGSYFWDFGNGATLSDTSHATNPTYTYPIIGTYTVTLVVNKGTACSLTITKIIKLSSVTANFTSSSTGCVNVGVAFTDGSTVSSNSTISGWSWDFGDGPPTSILQNPSHVYISSGTYTVRLIVTSAAGCKDTITHLVTIQKQPKANAGNDTTSCTNNPTIKLTGTVVNATGGIWSGNGTFAPSNTFLNPTYTPSSTALINGKDTLLFITTGNGSCPPDTDKVYINFSPGPTASAGGNIQVCKDTVSVPVCATITVASGVKWKTLGTGTFINDSILCTSYVPSTADTIAGSVIIYITTTGNGTCLAAKDSTTITFTATPKVVITSKDSACSISTIPFAVNVTTGSGIWIGGGGSFSISNTALTGTYTPTAAEIAAGKARLIFKSTNNGGCRSNSDTIDVIISPKANVNAGANVIVCRDTVYVPLCATITPIGGKWATMGSGTFGNANLTCTSYFPSNADRAAGSVIVYITSTNNGFCSAVSDSVIITFSPPTSSIITSNDSACSGNPFPFAVNASTGKGIWTSSGGGSTNFAPSNTSLTGFYTPSATDIAAGFVKLYFMSTNNGGCRASYDTINVILLPSPVAKFTEVSACPFLPVLFTNGSTSIDPIISWDWTFGDSSPTNPSQNPTHIYKAGGSYPVTLIVTSTNGCIDTVTNTVNVFEKPIANFDVKGTCLNDASIFWDSSKVLGSTIISWIWTFGDLPGSNLQNPSHTYTVGGNYPITLIVQSAQGCIDTVAKTITVSSGPIADFIADDFTSDVNQTVHFTDQSHNTPIISWFWNFGDKSTDSTSILQKPSHVFLVGGFYDVCLIVTDINGCMDTVCKTQIVSLPPDVPKGFTPNGDGHNDIFYVYGGPFKKLKFKIYNNWGELVFEADSQADGWDGKRNGVDQAVGVYVWTAEATGEDDQEYKLSGDVTLLR